MKTAAVVAEYNPFHAGHALHLEQTCECFGATHTVAVMSGNFVQRGECACASKFTRTRMALLGGADLVVELPLPWATAGAEKFALGGAALADALGCVDVLSFGSESGDMEPIKRTAQAVMSEDAQKQLKTLMAQGMTFAAAREQSAESVFPGAATVLRSPNDTLAVEYCKALTALSSDIEPVCVLRRGAEHDGETADGIASASHIRQLMNGGGDYSQFIPAASLEPLKTAVESGKAPARQELLDRTTLYRLRQMSADDMAVLPDISEGLENRIFRCSRQAGSVAELCGAVKVKRYTHARIRRIVLAALLGVTAQDCAGTPPYIRVLGMNARGREILAAAKPTLPVITRAADISQLDCRGRRIFELECRAGDVFALAQPVPDACSADLTQGIIVV